MEVAALFSRCASPWWIAGGHAIELAAGRTLREHVDIDVLLLRRDQQAAQTVLAGWEWWAAGPPGILRPWAPGETLRAAVHDIWCRGAGDQPWRIQLMLDECDGKIWVSRRNPGLRRAIASIGTVAENGVPYLAPEIQLFYRAEDTRPKDEADFTAIRPLLSGTHRNWLREAISETYGAHPWQARR
jgi:hypothetical protein